jgi:hypothetical protein
MRRRPFDPLATRELARAKWDSVSLAATLYRRLPGLA